MDGAGTPYTGISPPAVLTGCPLCLRRLTAFQGRFNARTEAGQSYLPNMRVIAPSQPRPVCAQKAAPPIPPLLVGIMACSIPHGFPFGRISDVSNRPIQFSDCCQPAQAYRSGYIRAEWQKCRNVSQNEPYFLESGNGKAAARRLSPSKLVTQISSHNVDELRVGRRVHKLSTCNHVEKIVVKVTPAVLNKCAEIALHTTR